MVVVGQQQRVAADVVALLTGAERGAHDDVDGLAEVDLGVALLQRLQRIDARSSPGRP
jgi:hypothetical protein